MAAIQHVPNAESAILTPCRHKETCREGLLFRPALHNWRSMVCQVLLGSLLVGSGSLVEQPSRSWVLSGAKRRACGPSSRTSTPTQVRSRGRGQRLIVAVSNSENSAIPFNLEQDYVEAKVEAGICAL